ncbi:MAG: ABC transporter ATP-binding protein [Sphaerochaetaceae bacterium]
MNFSPSLVHRVAGKTTLLRMIAGFNTIEGGVFYFNNEKINDLNPAKRNIGMVFQNYAIFPNMTVRKNVAFGLTNRNLDKKEIYRRTNKFLDLVKMREYENRMPDKLSGGQQQRVALARALAIEPNVLLMDEPLSNLDAKLRIEMREIIKEIQNKLRITTVYVTHDQEEAMAISDRIAVMNYGEIQQIGTPISLYLRPQNAFVANFVGASNFISGKIKTNEGKPTLVFADGFEIKMNNLSDKVKDGQEVIIAVRPEEFIVSEKRYWSDSGRLFFFRTSYSLFFYT